MASITLKGVPEEIMRRLRTLARDNRRSLNQQAIVLLERSVSGISSDFGKRYDEFLRTRGRSPLSDEDLEGLRDTSVGRQPDLG
jgi:hypothetical protein